MNEVDLPYTQSSIDKAKASAPSPPLSRKPRTPFFAYKLNALRYYGQFIDSLEVYLDTY
jgi:hypothetical protein